MCGATGIRDVNDLVRPARIGPYRIDATIGRGGMGVVYLGFDPELKRQVAIKALPAFWVEDHDRQRRLRREAQILAGFNHPNIAVIHGLEVEDSGAAHLIMEYVPGRTLRELLRDEPPDLGSGLRLCATIARAMEMVHNRGIIHRDLKPDNVRITPEGLVKVLDFGLAVSSGPAPPIREPDPERTGSHRPSLESRIAQVGTPGYMSPEQVLGQPVDDRADVFAFGCILFETVARRRAFAGGSTESLFRAVLEDEPDWTLLPEGMPGAVREVLPRCLERNVLGRARMTEARAAMEQGLEDLRAPARRAPQRPVPTNLPAETSTFVGRAAVRESLVALLREARLVTLTGPPGCGKTRLALGAAREALQAHPDGGWLIELAGLHDGAAVARGIAEALAVGCGASSPEDALVTHLRAKRALLLLDNCEHVLGDCVRVSQALLRSCPQLRILATSQEVFGVPGEMAFPLPPLTLPGPGEPPSAAEVAPYESVRLFVERATAVNPAFRLTDENAKSVATICQRLDGMPLAIELAARHAGMLSPAQIAGFLDQQLDFLTRGRAGQVSLREALERSYSRLSTEEQQLLRTLAFLAPGWTLAMARQAARTWFDDLKIVALLDRLVSTSCVVASFSGDGPPTYRLLEGMRHLALEHGREDVLERASADQRRA